MGVIPDCDSLLLSVSEDQLLFRQGDQDTADWTQLVEAVNQWEDVEADVRVLVSTGNLESTRLRDYLRHHVGQGIDVLVRVIDPKDATAVIDPQILDRALNFFGVPVSSPVRTGTGNPTRREPPELEVERRALSDLAGLPEGPSLAKLQNWLTTAPLGPARIAAVPKALFGKNVSRSHLPASPALMTGVLGGEFQPIDPAALHDEMTSGRAVAALVQGRDPVTGARTATWIVAGQDRTPLWVPERGGSLQPFNLDGAEDSYTASVERHGTALLVAPGGTGYTRPEQVSPKPVGEPVLAVNTRREGNAILVGAWAAAADSRKSALRAAAVAYGAPVIMVDVRHAVGTDGQRRLTPAIRAELHETLRRSTHQPVVLASEFNQELVDIVDRYRGASVDPVLVSTSGSLENTWTWTLRHDGNATQYTVPTKDMLTHAAGLAAPADTTTPLVVRGLLGAHTWAEAEAHFNTHLGELRTPGAAGHVRRLQEQSTARNQSEGYPDRVLPAVETLLRTASRTAASTGTVLEPQHVFVSDKTAPHTGPVSAEFLLGYLTSRPLAARAGAEMPGDYATGLLWLREMIQAAVSSPEGLGPQQVLSHADALAIIQAKGELDGERATRQPGEPEQLRAHAAVAEAALTILTSDPAAPQPDRTALLAALDCLTGEDRVAWAHIVWDVLTPAGPEHKSALDTLLNDIAACH